LSSHSSPALAFVHPAPRQFRGTLAVPVPPLSSALRPPPAPLSPSTPLFRSPPDGIRASATTEKRSLDQHWPAGHQYHRAADLHRSEEHTSALQSRFDLVCRLPLERKN